MREEINFAQCALFIAKDRVLFLCQPQQACFALLQIPREAFSLPAKRSSKIGLMLARK